MNHKHRVSIQYVNPLTGQVQTFGLVQCNKAPEFSLTDTLADLTSLYDQGVEVLSIYIAVETT